MTSNSTSPVPGRFGWYRHQPHRLYMLGYTLQYGIIKSIINQLLYLATVLKYMKVHYVAVPQTVILSDRLCVGGKKNWHSICLPQWISLKVVHSYLQSRAPMSYILHQLKLNLDFHKVCNLKRSIKQWSMGKSQVGKQLFNFNPLPSNNWL